MEDEERAPVALALSGWGCCVHCVLRFLGERSQATYRLPRDVRAKYTDCLMLERWLQSLKSDTDSDTATDRATPSGDTINDTSIGDIANNVSTGDASADTAKDVSIGDTANDMSTGDTAVSTGDSGVCVTCLGVLQQSHCSEEFLYRISEKVKSEKFEFSNFFCSLTFPVALLVREHAIWVLLKELLPDVYSDNHGDIKMVKDVWKWINGARLVEKLAAPLDQKSSFEVAMMFEHTDTAGECNFLCDLCPDQFRKHKNREMFTKIRVGQVLSEMDDSTFKSCYQCPPRRLKAPCECVTIRCKHDAIYVAGRYNKYSRTLSQTPWIIDGSRKTESSIEELVCTKIQDLFRADEYRFSASGREDVDVKMLGSGRPFVMDMTSPHRVTVRPEELDKLQKEINSSTTEIAVRDLQIVTREETNRLKEGEMLKTKTYSALCWAQTTLTPEDMKKLDSVKDLALQQKTPIRVLHRRPLGVREKCVHKMSAELLDPHHFRLQLSTQAGTYIKEFVHGDFGRTRPNLGELLQTDCDILELNVEVRHRTGTAYSVSPTYLMSDLRCS
ncbi:hypothetical protein NP493_270g00024 [Ridgeia piscesae]|uniref:tRNA pseudouridine(55) synthase n=1 Tax=Ridgeia piscesae TaxID=27915 RepID=A0AAD9UCK0_RIDPI|nr:hypothetical protein NP493_270g00024 [Ridgeia piscesae]